MPSPQPRDGAADPQHVVTASKPRGRAFASAKPPASTAPHSPVRSLRSVRADRLVPSAMEVRARARSAVTVGRVAMALIAVQTILRGWTCVRGYFYLDDLAFTGRSMDYPLWSVTYLSLPYNNHVMPGAFVWVWLTTHAFPLQWLPVAAVMIALQLGLSLLIYRLLVELFGRRPAILVPLAIALLSPISLPAFLWWAAALNQLPQQLAIVAALLFHVGYLRTGRLRLALAGPLVVLAGLLFSEKTLLAVPLLVGLTVAYFTSGGFWARVRQTLRRDAPVWVGYAVVAFPYLAYYVVQVPSPLRPAAAGHDVADLTTQSLFRATIPGLLGGPWQWTRIGAAGARADPDAFLVVVAFLVAGVVVASSLVLWRRAGRAWLVLLGYSALNLGLLARSRATFIGPVIGTEYRYQTDVAIVAALALALATIPVAGRFRHADVEILTPRPEVRRLLTEKILSPLREAAAAPATSEEVVRLTSGTATALFLASAVWSTVAYDPLWVDNPAREFVTTARAGLATLPPGTVVGNVPVPDDVAWPLLYPYNQTYRLFGPLLASPRRLVPGASASEMVVPDSHGYFRRALVAGPTAEEGPTAHCGWLLGPRAVVIPLRATATDAVPVIRIGYTSNRPTTITVRINGRTSAVDLAPGAGAFFLAATGPITEIEVDPTGDNARVCTDDIAAGVPVPVPGTSP